MDTTIKNYDIKCGMTLGIVKWNVLLQEYKLLYLVQVTKVTNQCVFVDKPPNRRFYTYTNTTGRTLLRLAVLTEDEIYDYLNKKNELKNLCQKFNDNYKEKFNDPKLKLITQIAHFTKNDWRRLTIKQLNTIKTWICNVTKN